MNNEMRRDVVQHMATEMFDRLASDKREGQPNFTEPGADQKRLP
jgi:hypothetical protein